jgi:hypothetical protein
MSSSGTRAARRRALRASARHKYCSYAAGDPAWHDDDPLVDTSKRWGGALDRLRRYATAQQGTAFTSTGEEQRIEA